MSDEIRDFVDRNREEFDHLEAPAFDLARFKNTLPKKEVLIKKLPFYKSPKWLAAACVLIVVATSWLVYQQKTAVETVYTKTKTVKKEAIINAPVAVVKDAQPKANAKENQVSFVSLNSEPKQKKTKPNVNVDEYKGLRDSSSASMRLLAIMEIEKSDNINNKTIDMLSKTLNHDGNTNVRLAALSVLQKYSFDSHVASLLVKSLDKQNDPIVQLGLLGSVGKMKNVNIDEKLYALANNPETFVAVRDEANKILLNQDKL
ncbi:HEAT repeat domain-containing protein [Pedobacter sp. Leaf170]|uniref:HEAT repeat domain-containing protein n=1 Tax=Pedobacter sp. Leaf170 TaxID=2876558 RepID=UPI001E65DBEF|nr:HEAT repeat domain-containing protein [Pedobacter sp. Leaf170]